MILWHVIAGARIQPAAMRPSSVYAPSQSLNTVTFTDREPRTVSPSITKVMLFYSFSFCFLTSSPCCVMYIRAIQPVGSGLVDKDRVSLKIRRSLKIDGTDNRFLTHIRIHWSHVKMTWKFQLYLSPYRLSRSKISGNSYLYRNRKLQSFEI